MLVFPFFIPFLLFGECLCSSEPNGIATVQANTSTTNGTVSSSVSAKQESPIKSSFEERNRTLDTLVLQPKQENSTYTDKDILAAFDEAEPKCLISKVTLRNMDLKTFAVPVLNGIIERMCKIRSEIIRKGPTLLYSFRDHFLKEFKKIYETKRELKMKNIKDYFQEFKNKFKPSAEILSKSASDLYSYCCDKCIFYLSCSISKEESGEYEIKKKFASLVQRIAEKYAKIEDDPKPNAVDYFNSELDKEGEKFIKEYLEAEDMEFLRHYSNAYSECYMFPKFTSLLRDYFERFQSIQEIKAYLESQKHENFSVVHDELKRMLTEFIDKVHNAGMNENAPDDIYLETFNEFKMKFSDSFDLGFEKIRWDPDSIKEASDDEFGKTLMYSLKHRKGYAKTACFGISYPKNEKKESDEME